MCISAGGQGSFSSHWVSLNLSPHNQVFWEVTELKQLRESESTLISWDSLVWCVALLVNKSKRVNLISSLPELPIRVLFRLASLSTQMAYLALVILFPFKAEQRKVAFLSFFFFFLKVSPMLGVRLLLRTEQPPYSMGISLGLYCHNCLFLNQYCNPASARLQRLCMKKKKNTSVDK